MITSQHSSRPTINYVQTASDQMRIFSREEGGAEHCQGDIISMATDYIHDWLALYFDREGLPSTADDKTATVSTSASHQLTR